MYKKIAPQAANANETISNLGIFYPDTMFCYRASCNTINVNNCQLLYTLNTYGNKYA